MASASPSIADLLEATSRELAGTDARVYRRVGTHLQRTAQAIEDSVAQPLLLAGKPWPCSAGARFNSRASPPSRACASSTASRASASTRRLTSPGFSSSME